MILATLIPVILIANALAVTDLEGEVCYTHENNTAMTNVPTEYFKCMLPTNSSLDWPWWDSAFYWLFCDGCSLARCFLFHLKTSCEITFWLLAWNKVSKRLRAAQPLALEKEHQRKEPNVKSNAFIQTTPFQGASRRLGQDEVCSGNVLLALTGSLQATAICATAGVEVLQTVPWHLQGLRKANRAWGAVHKYENWFISLHETFDSICLISLIY